MSYGAALAQGRPLVLALSVPVWVVNGTQLAVPAGVAEIESTGHGDNGSGLPTSGDIVIGESALSSSVGLTLRPIPWSCGSAAA